MTTALHFCPDDGWFGDAMPLYHDGVYHIYYTKAYKEQYTGWGHLSTTDLIHYTEHPDPFDSRLPRTPKSTGCIYWDKGIFHAYYAGEDENGVPAILHAESPDGVLFAPTEGVCFSRPDNWYRNDGGYLTGTWRDPFVVYDEEAKLYRMVFCAKPPANPERPNCFAGAIGRAISPDLRHWECLPPMELTGIATSIECPEIYRDDHRWVLIYYWHETRFRSSHSPNGPWERGEVISPDHMDFMAARSMYDGQRRLLVGWIPRRNCDCMERIWGGNMLFPREITLRDGKTPESRFAREIDQLFCVQDSSLLPECLHPCGDGWKICADGWQADCPTGGTLAYFPTMPDTGYIRLTVTLSKRNGLVMLLLGTGEGDQQEPLDTGYALMLDASENLIRLRRHYTWDQRNDIAVLPYTFREDIPIHLQILRHQGILEVGVDGKQTMVTRLLEDRSGGLGFSVQDTAASFADFSVWTMKENPE